MSDTKNYSENKGNPEDWSAEGWSGEWRRLGIEWWQFRILDPNNQPVTDWIDYKDPFYSNLMCHMKRCIQHEASLVAKSKAEVHKMSFAEIVQDSRS